MQIFKTEITKDKEKGAQLEELIIVKHAFHGAHVLDELKVATEQARHDCSESRRPLFIQIAKVLEQIDKHAPIIDVMIQQQPFFVNLVWGSVRFIIQVSQILISCFHIPALELWAF